MKKTRIVLAVLAMAAFVSCQENEFSNDTYTPAEGEILFKVTNGKKATKAMDDVAVIKGETFSVGNYAGSGFYLEETVTRIDDSYGPETKGTPGFTENFQAVYDGFNAAVYQVGEADAYEEDGRFENVNGLIYKRKYGNDLWDEDKGLYFFLRAGYKTGTLTGVSDLEYDSTDGTISFSYDGSSMKTAAAQSDILFTSRKVEADEYDLLINKEQGVPVLFHHALTGVKFRLGNDNSSDTKTIITRVEFSGLADGGDCVITPRPETNGYVDDKTGDFSSGDSVVWDEDKLVYGGTKFYQNFSNPTYSKTSDNTYSYTNDGTFGSSWYSAAADNNLNDANGTLTFWFIPQKINSDVTLTVTFLVKTPDTPAGNNNGEEITHTINFGEQLAAKNVEWKAGELRTYTLNPNDIAVGIFDDMTALTKDNLHVTNTGNVAEYVRVMVIGNWYGWESEASKNKGDEPFILVGYTSDGTDGKDEMVRPWFREDEVYGLGFDDTFPMGRPASGREDWVRGTGSYFYYTEVIGPGDVLSGTEALFQEYVLDNTMIPKIYIPTHTSSTRVEAYGVHLVMEVVAQAIGAVKPDGSSFEDCWEAWTAATGSTIAPK